MRPLPMSFNWLTRSTASQAQLLPWKISKSANALFRFPTASGWRLPETTLRFLTYTGKSRSSLVTSARFDVITTALSTTLPALSRETYTPCLCFSLFASHFLFRMTIPESIEFRQFDTFPRLRNCTPKLPCILHPPWFFVDAHPWLFLRLQLLHTLFASLTVLFLPFSVSVVLCLLVYRVFFACQFSRNYPRQFFRGGHSYIVDLTFRILTCPFLLAVVSRTWDLVCINLSFASRDFVCPLMTSIRIIRFCPSAWTPRFQRESSCVSLAHGQRWLFLLLLIRCLL